VSVTDLADEHLLQIPRRAGVARCGHRTAWAGPRAARRDCAPVEEKLEHVARGTVLVVLPTSTAAFYTRPDVPMSPVDDIVRRRICLAGDCQGGSPLVPEFVAIAVAVPASDDPLTPVPRDGPCPADRRTRPGRRPYGRSP